MQAKIRGVDELRVSVFEILVDHVSESERPLGVVAQLVVNVLIKACLLQLSLCRKLKIAYIFEFP